MKHHQHPADLIYALFPTYQAYRRHHYPVEEYLFSIQASLLLKRVCQ